MMIELWILTFALMLIRLATFCLTFPIWNSHRPPNTVKIGLVFALTIFWFFGQPVSEATTTLARSIDWYVFGAAVIREILIGGVLGFVFHIFVIPARIAGAYIAQELGLNLATLSDPSMPEQTSVVASLFQLAAIIMFFALNLHHFVLRCLDAAFQAVPVGATWNAETLPELSLAFFQLIDQGLTIAAPVGIVLFITLVSLLLLARAVPSLNLFSVGLSVRLGVGFIALIIFLPFIVANLRQQFQWAEDLIVSLVRSFFFNG